MTVVRKSVAVKHVHSGHERPQNHTRLGHEFRIQNSVQSPLNEIRDVRGDCNRSTIMAAGRKKAAQLLESISREPERSLMETVSLLTSSLDDDSVRTTIFRLLVCAKSHAAVMG
jgi:hypothetical protein